MRTSKIRAHRTVVRITTALLRTMKLVTGMMRLRRRCSEGLTLAPQLSTRVDKTTGRDTSSLLPLHSLCRKSLEARPMASAAAKLTSRANKEVEQAVMHRSNRITRCNSNRSSGSSNFIGMDPMSTLIAAHLCRPHSITGKSLLTTLRSITIQESIPMKAMTRKRQT